MKAFLRSERGRCILALVIGFGLSTFFRKCCKDKECMDFKGPSLKEIEENIYRYDKKCYQFKPKPASCSPIKRIVEFA
jgi:hypothetical protein